MLPTEELKQEHRVIERMLAVMETAAVRANAGAEPPADFFVKAVYFVRNFADRCHHGKEEDNLFPAMEKRGISKNGGPIAVMLMEHERGRSYVRAMEEAGKRFATGDRTALRPALENALAYAQLLRQHIDKEDNILYPMADRMLTATDQQELLQKFEKVEQERIGAGKHDEYLKLVEELEQAVNK